jgi:hypothetical protein
MTTVPSAVAAPPAQISEFEERTYRNVVRRLLPVLLLCYVVAYLNRVNVGFAKLQMLDDLGLSNIMYAIGASVFFWGYFIFETFPGQLLSGAAAAAGIAMINAIGNLSGFTGSMITAVAKNLTGDINNGTYALGACLLVSCMLILLVPRSMLTRAAPADASKPNRHTAHAAQRASGSTLPMTER